MAFEECIHRTNRLDYNSRMRHSQKTYAIVMFIIFLVGILFFLGKIRYAINPFARYMLLQQYINSVKQHQTIDPERYWEFRDFYAATTSTFTPKAILQRKPFLSFKTAYIESYDSLVENKGQLSNPEQKSVNIILSSPNEIMYATDQMLYIRFFKTLEEMHKANGFFRYFGTDITPYENYFWYNETTIRL